MRLHHPLCIAGRAIGALVAGALLAQAPSGFAAGCVARSGAQTNALVELYTSEGCDSCPPADRWLATSFRPGAAPAGAVALAFHVDYWDRLGWKDRFASAAYTERQYDVTRTGNARFAYTPQVVLQGRDLPDWHGKDTLAAIAAINARPAPASVTVNAVARDGAIDVHTVAAVTRAADRKDAALFIALTENSLVSDVKAGENAGARLTHDHVVRVLRAGPAVGTDGTAEMSTALKLPAERGSATTIVAFVQNTRTGEVLQAQALAVGADCAPAR
jgi:hypothetical protein